MKKSFLILLSSILAVFLITGCADDTTSNNGGSTGGTGSGAVTEGSQDLDITITGPTAIDLTNPDTLIGAYELTYFYTNGGTLLPISSDCTKVEEYTGTADTKCVQGTNNVEFQGYGTITVDETNINVITKMQMTNAGLQAGTGYFAAAKDNQYSYTVFTAIPTSNISGNIINNGSSAVKGTSGRTLTKNILVQDDNGNDLNNPGGTTYTFEVDVNDSFTLINKLVDKSNLAAANVTVRMKKISDTPISDMKMNVPLPTPAITGFVANPQ